MLSEITVIRVKVEAVKGTAIGGDQDLYVEDLNINPTGEFIQRKGTGKYLGITQPGVIGGEMGKCTFTSELRGDGAAGLEPGVAILLQACGLLQTAEVYNTHSSFTAQKTISIDVFEDGASKTLYGAAGTFTMEGEAGGRVLLKFEFSGLYEADSNVAVPAFAPSTTPPVMWGAGTFSYGGISQMISKISLDIGNEVSPQHDVVGPGGVRHYFVSTYDPSVSWDPEAAIYTSDPVHSDWLAGVNGAMALAMTDGTDTFTWDFILVQYKEIAEGIRDNIRNWDATGQCRHSAGDDAVILTVT